MSPNAPDTAWTMVQSFMRERCGVVMRDDQAYLLESRLSPVARRFAYVDARAYVRAACAPGASEDERRALVDAMTTHETLFFRDPPFWQRFETSILPALARLDRPVRIWSAACSTGQEPYSLAMMLEESFPSLGARTELIATDVAEETVEQARRGEYGAHEVTRGLAADRLTRFFEPVAGGARFRVLSRVRERVRFEAHNLVGRQRDPDRCDVVLCRNVLIYFEEGQRRAVFDRLRRAARPEGWIGVGSTESFPARMLAPGWYSNAEADAAAPVTGGTR